MQEQLMESASVVVDVTDADFMETVVEESKRRPVVVDLWASWCGPCKTLGPILERVAEQRGGAFLLARLDVDVNPYTAGQFGVQSIPTLMLFKGGQPVEQLIGAQSKPAILSKILRTASLWSRNRARIAITVSPTSWLSSSRSPSRSRISTQIQKRN